MFLTQHKEVIVHCNAHPEYKAVMPPRANCKACRMMYAKTHWDMGYSALAAKLGVTEGTLRNYGKELQQSEPPPPVSEQVRYDADRRKLARDRRDTDRKYKELLARFEELQDEHDALLDINETLAETHTIEPHKGAVSESTVVVVASDWHVAERVKPSDTNSMNEYSLAIARARVDDFFKAVVRLTNIEAKNTPIGTMVLALLGDFVNGVLREEDLETNQLASIDESILARDLLQSGIDFILDNTGVDLVIPCSCGNHGRLTRYPHSATEMDNSLELFIYSELKRAYEDNDRVTFIIERGYHTYLDVYDVTLRLHHGHAVRYSGGVGGLTIPMNKAIAQWNKLKHADLDILGHWHSFFYGGNFLVNGSLVGYNAYAVRIKASFERPCQAFLVINQRLNAVIAVRPILV